MPTTRLKNSLYRALLPFCAPGPGRDPVCGTEGHAVRNMKDFVRLVRRHHVLGSATLIASGSDSCVLLTSSDSPSHMPRRGTFFRVASITKMATAALTMHLVDRQLLDPDKPVADWFGNTDASGLGTITLKHLLTHTSGLIDPPSLERDVESGTPFPDLLPAARRFPPGTFFHYSNLGFGLIGCVLEASLGRPAGILFRDELFLPLGMNATLEACTLQTGQIMPVTRILPYRKGSDLVLTKLGSTPLTEADPLCHYGHTAGSMYTDIDSLSILLKTVTGERPGYLSSRAVKAMAAEHATYGALSPTLSYGLGLLIIQDRSISDGRVIGHQGFAYGCADGAFRDEKSGRIMITLNGGCSEARKGRLGLGNYDFLKWAFRKELPSW